VIMTIDLFFIMFVLTQVVGEAAPISSSGHLLLIQMIMRRLGIASTTLPHFFDDFLHGPMIMIIMIYFYKAWWSPMRLLFDLLRKYAYSGFRYTQLRDSHKNLVSLFLKISGMVIIADGATAVLYVLIKKWLKHYSWFGSDWMLLVGFVITMIVLLAFRSLDPSIHFSQASAEKNVSKDVRQSITFHTALILGIIQGVALLPGISRFGVTVVAANILGISPRRSLQFSFLMFFPLITAAFFINGLPAVIKMGPGLLSLDKLLLYGLATLTAYFLFSFSCSLALTNRFWWFGLYMILPILVTIGLVIK